MADTLHDELASVFEQMKAGSDLPRDTVTAAALFTARKVVDELPDIRASVRVMPPNAAAVRSELTYRVMRRGRELFDQYVKDATADTRGRVKHG